MFSVPTTSHHHHQKSHSCGRDYNPDLAFPATRVTRTIFWRSRTVRKICTVLTGLDFTDSKDKTAGAAGKVAPPAGKGKTPHDIAASLAAKRSPDSPGIRFTFILYENQRRWLGIGWTSSMLAYERASWTDDMLNTVLSKDKFELPEVEGGHAKWIWVEGSEWNIDGTSGDGSVNQTDPESDGGWIFYDNKWRDGRKGKDGWGRYTRRRKWCRDAELVEVDDESNTTSLYVGQQDETASTTTTLVDKSLEDVQGGETTAKDDIDSSSSARRRKRWFARRPSQPTSEKSTALSVASSRSTRDDYEEDVHVPLRIKEIDGHSNWGLGDDAEMSFESR